MDSKKVGIRRLKRPSKVIEDNFWDCSVCTYRNTAEAFKCLMCDVRKAPVPAERSSYESRGTSTRKPRLNSALVAQQAATLPGVSGIPNAMINKPSQRNTLCDKSKHTKGPARLKNVDRSTAQTREVTVNSVTVVITEYKPIHIGDHRESADQSYSESNDSHC